jgi:hypothetical protein
MKLSATVDTLVWGVLGILSAIAVHYMLYRMALPLEPFIYQAF